MKEIITALMLWISTQTGWPIPDHPNITYIQNGKEFFLLSHDCDKKPDQKICLDYDGDESNILALYNHLTKTIYLNKDFWIASVKVQSILLHELVHHMQYYRDYKGYSMMCKGLIEKEAYDLQEEWLEKRGLTLEDTIQLGALFRHVITQCDVF